jgi:hypothetical protein
LLKKAALKINKNYPIMSEGQPTIPIKILTILNNNKINIFLKICVRKLKIIGYLNYWILNINRYIKNSILTKNKS